MYSLRDLRKRYAKPIDTIKTWLIDHDVSFGIAGRTWVIADDAVAQLDKINTEHDRKLKALGLKTIKTARRKKSAASA